MFATAIVRTYLPHMLPSARRPRRRRLFRSHACATGMLTYSRQTRLHEGYTFTYRYHQIANIVYSR